MSPCDLIWQWSIQIDLQWQDQLKDLKMGAQSIFFTREVTRDWNLTKLALDDLSEVIYQHFKFILENSLKYSEVDKKEL